MSEPNLKTKLGDLPISPDNDKPLGGINPYNEHFDKIGSHFLQLFIDHARLEKHHKVLDIGCGTGRIAKQMAKFLSGNTYTGIDNNKRFIEFCKNEYPFNFDHIDTQHDEYNENGLIDPNSARLPYEDRSFDFICSIATFNHLKFLSVANYIREISRLLRPKGTFFGTIILLNQRSMEQINSRESHPFKFEKRDHDNWYDYDERPLWNVAQPEMPIRRVFISSRMMIKEPIRYGEWCGSPAAITGHDSIIAIKGTGFEN